MSEWDSSCGRSQAVQSVLDAWGCVMDPLPLSSPAEPFEDALRAPQSAPVSVPPAQVVASMEEQLRREPWYHRKMNRKEAEKLLKVNGDFLVRESTTTPGQYVLTGLQGGQPKHLLLVDPEGVVSPHNPKAWGSHTSPSLPHLGDTSGLV